MCQLWQIKENIKYNPFDDISISFNPLYVKENSHNKFTLLHWLICNAEWKFFNSFWLLKQNTFSQSCANSVTKSKRTLLKNGWSTPVECLNSLRTWRSRGHFKSSEDYYCVSCESVFTCKIFFFIIVFIFIFHSCESVFTFIKTWTKNYVSQNYFHSKYQRYLFRDLLQYFWRYC